MAHYVRCAYCDSNFDRDKFAYVEVKARRYAHAKCYLTQKAKNDKLPELEIHDPNDFVKCCYCKKIINKKIEQYQQVTNTRYAHIECVELEEKREKTDQEKLELYIQKIFGQDYVSPQIRKQITRFVNEYNYTYTGMLKALVYFYEVKKREITVDGIGIIPYIYNEAYNYYYALWLAKEANKDKDISAYIPKEIEIVIPPPQRDIVKRNLFQFLDKDEITDE